MPELHVPATNLLNLSVSFTTIPRHMAHANLKLTNMPLTSIQVSLLLSHAVVQIMSLLRADETLLHLTTAIELLGLSQVIMTQGIIYHQLTIICTDEKQTKRCGEREEM